MVTRISQPLTAVASRVMEEIRSMMGNMTLDEIQSRRGELTRCVTSNLSPMMVQDWGIALRQVTISDVILPEEIAQAMSRTAIARQDAEAKIVSSHADIAVAQNMKQAAEVYSDNPVSLRLRELATWTAMKNATFVVTSGHPRDLVAANLAPRAIA